MAKNRAIKERTDAKRLLRKCSKGISNEGEKVLIREGIPKKNGNLGASKAEILI